MADREQVERYDAQVHELQSQVKFLEEEVGLLRRRLTNAPRQVTVLEEKLVETREQLDRAVGAEPEARRRACAPSATRSRRSPRRSRSSRSPPPPSVSTSASNDDGSIDVFTAGRKMRVMPAPDIDRTRLPSRACRSCSTSR